MQTDIGSTCLTDGDTHTYGERWIPSCGCIISKVDGNQWQASTFNPWDWWDSSNGFSPQFSGEVKHLESDMPGNSANPTNFSDVQGQRRSDGNFYSYPCGQLTILNELAGVTRADGESSYNQTTSCPSFNIYTDTAGN